MKHALSILALAALAGCGGGGGGGGGFMPIVAQPAAKSPDPILQAVEPLALTPTNPGCKEVGFSVDCPLVPGEIGVGVPAGTWVVFYNRTDQMLQIDAVRAATGETQLWSEFCVYRGELFTWQSPAGVGEVGCTTKGIGENYGTIRWGAGTGLSVAPGERVYLNSHTEPAAKNHTYSMSVREQTTGLYAWRQPQRDEVIPCDGQERATVASPWRNESGRAMHLIGAGIYSESGTPASINQMSGPACIYVMAADGSTKYQNCDDNLRRRGEVSFPVVTIEPGEYVSAQARNACAAPGVWDWAAWLRVW